jgi:hypothetical protein
VLVAQSLEAPSLPHFARLAADLTSSERLLCCDSDALVDGVSFVIHVKAKPAELLLHLRHLKL